MVVGDCRDVIGALPEGSVQTCITSPPYWSLRYYLAVPPLAWADGWVGHWGLEPTFDMWIAHCLEIFRVVRRVLRDDGTLWLNVGKSWNGKRSFKGGKGTDGVFERRRKGLTGVTDEESIVDPSFKQGDLILQGPLLAEALRRDGWWLRQDVIWCLSGGTRLYAKTSAGVGPYALKDLVKKDPASVMLWNGKKWTQVVAWTRSRPPAQALELILQSGERVGCTEGHVWPTQRGNIQAHTLRVGDVITTSWLPDSEEVQPRRLSSKDIGWLCGLYLAEGSKYKENDFVISCHKDEIRQWFPRILELALAYGGNARHHCYGNSGRIIVSSRVLFSIIRLYIGGQTAHDKHLRMSCWRRNNVFLSALLDGYLEGDGYFDPACSSWVLNFTRNYALASALRTVAARLGLRLYLRPGWACCQSGKFPTFRGRLKKQTTHHNEKALGRVVAIRRSRARQFWDVEVKDEPHLFALGSGVLTHNSKRNPKPESVRTRPANAHEFVFLLAKSEDYFYDDVAVRQPYAAATLPQRGTSYGGEKTKDYAASGAEDPSSVKRRVIASMEKRGGRNLRTVWKEQPPQEGDVWELVNQSVPGAHTATFSEALVELCMKAGSKPGDLVIDPCGGSGTVGVVAEKLGRDAILAELSPEYARQAEGRIADPDGWTKRERARVRAERDEREEMNRVATETKRQTEGDE